MLFILLLTFVPFIHAQDFIISEIFANPKGRSRGHGYQWIELNNLSSKRIAVNSIHLAISTGKKKEIIFNKKIDLATTLFFDDYFLVAQDKFLGFNQCLRTPVIEIKDKEYVVPNNKNFSICISLNEQPFVCTHLSNKDKFEDGASLYYGEGSWLPEVCEWQKETCATPGLQSLICEIDPSFTDEIFDECSVGNQNIRIFPIKYENKYSPKITGPLTFIDEDKTDIWLIKYCRFNKEIKNLCEEINPPVDEAFLVKIRDLFGFSDKKSFLINNAQEDKELPIISIEGGTISLISTDSQGPFNYHLTNNQDETLLLGSVVKGGIKKLPIPNMSPLKIHLSGFFGEIKKVI